ncbi:MAG: hypothetical protein ACIAXF_11580 [Phycisphaerales bacterium JB063]
MGDTDEGGPVVPGMTTGPVVTDGPAVPAVDAPVGDVSAGPPVPPVPELPAGPRSGWETDLGCPQCGYNLRGLPYVARGRGEPGSGLLVDCPECGVRSDLGELAQRRWDKPWYKAPGFNLMTSPVAWLLLCGVGSVLFSVALRDAMRGSASMLMLMAFSMIVLTGWIGLLVWVYHRCGGVVGVLFSLLGHVIFVGYLAGLILVVSGAISTVVFFIDRRPGGSFEAMRLALAIGMLLGGVVLFVVGRICEKQVAGHCIRVYLRRKTTA